MKSAEQLIGDLHVYSAEPEQGSRAGMLLLPSLGGLGVHLRRYADDLAGSGLIAVAWDHFHGDSVQGLPLDQLMARARTVSDAVAFAEQARLLDYLLSERGCARVGVIGWCMGGRFALVFAARDQRVSSCVAYHPTVLRPLPPHQREDAVALSAEIACPVQLIVPGADQVVAAETFVDLRGALERRARAASIVHTYPGASHAFMDQRDASAANAVATQLAWPQTLAFLRATLLS